MRDNDELVFNFQDYVIFVPFDQGSCSSYVFPDIGKGWWASHDK